MNKYLHIYISNEMDSNEMDSNEMGSKKTNKTVNIIPDDSSNTSFQKQGQMYYDNKDNKANKENKADISQLWEEVQDLKEMIVLLSDQTNEQTGELRATIKVETSEQNIKTMEYLTSKDGADQRRTLALESAVGRFESAGDEFTRAWNKVRKACFLASNEERDDIEGAPDELRNIFKEEGKKEKQIIEAGREDEDLRRVEQQNRINILKKLAAKTKPNEEVEDNESKELQNPPNFLYDPESAFYVNSDSDDEDLSGGGINRQKYKGGYLGPFDPRQGQGIWEYVTKTINETYKSVLSSFSYQPDYNEADGGWFTLDESEGEDITIMGTTMGTINCIIAFLFLLKHVIQWAFECFIYLMSMVRYLASFIPFPFWHETMLQIFMLIFYMGLAYANAAIMAYIFKWDTDEVATEMIVSVLRLLNFLIEQVSNMFLTLVNSRFFVLLGEKVKELPVINAGIQMAMSGLGKCMDFFYFIMSWLGYQPNGELIQYNITYEDIDFFHGGYNKFNGGSETNNSLTLFNKRNKEMISYITDNKKSNTVEIFKSMNNAIDNIMPKYLDSNEIDIFKKGMNTLMNMNENIQTTLNKNINNFTKIINNKNSIIKWYNEASVDPNKLLFLHKLRLLLSIDLNKYKKGIPLATLLLESNKRTIPIIPAINNNKKRSNRPMIKGGKLFKNKSKKIYKKQKTKNKLQKNKQGKTKKHKKNIRSQRRYFKKKT